MTVQNALDDVAGKNRPALFWGSVYPLAPWTSRVVPDGPAPDGGGGGGDRKPGVYVNVTVPRGVVPVLRARAASVVDALSGREQVDSVAAGEDLGV